VETQKKLLSINYTNSDLKNLKENLEWKEIIKSHTLDFSDIKKTYLHSSQMLLFTIPIKNLKGEYYNIYSYRNNFIITKVNEIEKANGHITYEIKSSQNELFYKFDLNHEKKIGNWKFAKDIPFKEMFKDTQETQSTPTIEGPKKPCASMPFNACMNCFLIEVCGSDWMCMVACGAFIISCVGGAAAACIIL
jgi:hypothetical protein